MNKEIKKFIEDVDSIKMSYIEKDHLKKMVFDHVENNPIKQKMSFHSFLFSRRIMGMYVLAIFLVCIGISSSATKSLPGEVLYSIKTKVNEPIVKSLALSDGSKAKIHADIAEERLIELEKISKQFNPSQQVIDSLNDNFKENSVKVENYVSKIKEKGDLSTANKIISDFKTTLDVHNEILPKVIDDENDLREITTQKEKITDLNKTVDQSIASSTDPDDLQDIAKNTIKDSKQKIDTLKKSIVILDLDDSQKDSANKTIDFATNTVEQIQDNFDDGYIKEAISLSDQLNSIVTKTQIQIEVESELDKVEIIMPELVESASPQVTNTASTSSIRPYQTN